MGLKDDLTTAVKKTFREQWTEAETKTVPQPDDLLLDANDAKRLENAVVLYADIDGSTAMVDSLPWYRSAEVYKAYLHCASKVIRDEAGTITAYDGDRVMAIWPANNRTPAVRAAMKINYAVQEIIRPAFRDSATHYKDFVLKHVVGVDVGTLHAARIGVRGENDIVWVGAAANHAAKLCNLSEKPLWITKAVYDGMHESCRTTNGQNMWEKRRWVPMNNTEIYCSTWHWSIG